MSSGVSDATRYCVLCAAFERIVCAAFQGTPASSSVLATPADERVMSHTYEWVMLTNESCHTYEWVVQMNESRHTYACVIRWVMSNDSVRSFEGTHALWPLLATSADTWNEPCHTFEWVISCTYEWDMSHDSVCCNFRDQSSIVFASDTCRWIRHATRMKDFCRWMSHITRMNELYHTLMSKACHSTLCLNSNWRDKSSFTFTNDTCSSSRESDRISLISVRGFHRWVRERLLSVHEKLDEFARDLVGAIEGTNVSQSGPKVP